MDWQRHLLGYYGQPFLHYICLLGVIWGMLLGRSNFDSSGLLISAAVAR